MSRGLRTCLRGQLHVSLYMSAHSQAYCTLSGPGCCLQVSAVGEVLSVLMSCEATHVLHLGQLLWAGLGWAESWSCSVLWVFPHNSSKKPSQSYRQQQYLSTPMPHSLELSDLKRPAECFLLCSLFPLDSGQLKFLVMFLYNIWKSSLSVYSGPLFIFPHLLCLMFIYRHFPRSSMWRKYRGTFCALLFPSLCLAFHFLCFASVHTPRVAEGHWLRSGHVGRTQRSLIWSFCPRNP